MKTGPGDGSQVSPYSRANRPDTSQGTPLALSLCWGKSAPPAALARDGVLLGGAPYQTGVKVPALMSSAVT